MMLTDAGPLIALVDRRDPHNGICVAAMGRLIPPLVTLIPPFTEAMHLIAREMRWPGQEQLWTMVERGALVIHNLEPADLVHARDLMRQYRDVPMDFADAALVAYAERENLDEIFTLDRRGFSVYRLRGRRGFTIYP
jgi:hypothetical protein